MNIKFIVLESDETPYTTAEEPTVFLVKDNWNDWWEYKTLFGVYYSYEKSVEWIGTTKIGQKGLKWSEGRSIRPDIPSVFGDTLDNNFFSVGQDVTYYSKLNELGADIRFQILRGLNDIAFDEELYEEVKGEYITHRSLLRSVSTTSVKGQYRRLANGNAELTDYFFSFILPDTESATSFEVEVKSRSIPPSNLHIIIGRNGVGKTNLLKNIINYLRTGSNEYGEIISELAQGSNEDLFANLVSISFSSFDSGNDILDIRKGDKIKYYNIGLLKKEFTKDHTTNEKKVMHVPKNLRDLQKEFKDALILLSNSAKTKRWRQAIRTLESDPIFNGLGIEYLILPQYHDRIDIIFEKLSSGHKIVLLTITKLVETVEERSLVILDEPEIHLHPPLLSAFTRALSDLLIYRNAVALIATHSPVLVQEVPRNCTWVMNRTDNLVSFYRPDIETFGENISTLTREVFGLEVTSSGFHQYLKNLVDIYDDYEEILNIFNEQLGLEGRTILRSLLLRKGDNF
ncbi:AAA family ATPase [Bacillus sp. FJAT-52991]|uniref:AAA family ATPase n=1 Tax=Bacillus kandeliae TaxID=3129297 RepID=A0ABZ2N3E9_9BACI